MLFMLPPDRGAVRAPARAAVLAEWMTEWLGSEIRVEVAPSYRALALAIERNEVDLAWAPPAVCARVRRAVRTVLTVVRSGATSCRAVLVVRAGGGMTSPAHLAGKRAAWVDPLSTSGHLMALVYLHANGLDPRSLFSSQRFAGSYRDALADVIADRADVTSVFLVDGTEDATRRELHDLIGPTASSLALLGATPAAPFDALVIPSGLPASLALERKILALDHRAGVPAMLLEVCRADRFVRGSPADYAALDRVFDPVLLGP